MRSCSRLSRSLLRFVCLATLALSTDLRADGCFVMPPFVWDSFRDINEPTQNAILLHDKGREDMILQVRYEGPASEFGWLIPVPSQPQVAVASMASFYELSRFTQEYVHHRQQWQYAGGSAPSGSLPPVTVIEYRTVGGYDVAVLATESADSLARWLLQNSFAIRQGSQTVLRSYLEKHWFIVAIRVHLERNDGQLRLGVSPGGASKFSSASMRVGELHPIRISFDTPECIFPLKISSLNGRASEVLLYVLSAEPLTCSSLVKPVKYPDPNGSDYPGELEYSFPAAAVQANQLPNCSADLPRLGHRKWTFVKLRRVFRPEEMQDLHFQPLFPLIRSNLEGSNHYQALARLGEFQELAMPLWPDLAASPLGDNRVICCAMLHAYPRQRSIDLLLKLLGDEDINVRFQACAAAESYNDPRVISKLLLLLQDKYEIGRAAALSCGKLGVSDPRVISALIEVLDYQYPTPREEAQASLTAITGKKLQSPQQWRDWWAKNKASFMTR